MSSTIVGRSEVQSCFYLIQNADSRFLSASNFTDCISPSPSCFQVFQEPSAHPPATHPNSSLLRSGLTLALALSLPIALPPTRTPARSRRQNSPRNTLPPPLHRHRRHPTVASRHSDARRPVRLRGACGRRFSGEIPTLVRRPPVHAPL